VPGWQADAPLCFSGAGLDRADGLLGDEQWLAGRLTRPDTRILPLWRNRIALDDDWSLHLLDNLAVIREQAGVPVFLGLQKDRALFAVDLSGLDETVARGLAGEARLEGLRRAAPVMHPQQAAIAGYACALLRWHHHNRFCGRCGSPSESRNGGHRRLCLNAGCSRELFPRVDPAVIMLVEHAPQDGLPARCLLGHHRRMAPGRYSTLAGFVEPGESLEEAVRREVMEEVGVRVGAVSYQDSQPWPFPSSLMLGFRARAVTRTIQVDGKEIDRARWFSADEIRQGGDWEDGDAEGRLSLPGHYSIARHLIDGWLAEQP